MLIVALSVCLVRAYWMFSVWPGHEYRTLSHYLHWQNKWRWSRWLWSIHQINRLPGMLESGWHACTLTTSRKTSCKLNLSLQWISWLQKCLQLVVVHVCRYGSVRAFFVSLRDYPVSTSSRFSSWTEVKH